MMPGARPGVGPWVRSRRGAARTTATLAVMKHNDDMEGAAELVASAQYDDAKGTAAADFADQDGRGAAARLVALPAGFHPVAWSLELGELGTWHLSVHAVSEDEFGGDHDSISRAVRGKRVVLHTLDGSIAPQQLATVFKRLAVSVKAACLDGCTEVWARDSSWNVDAE